MALFLNKVERTEITEGFYVQRTVSAEVLKLIETGVVRLILK